MIKALLLTVGLVGLSTAQHLTSYSFPGYGFSWAAPACGYACWSVLSGATLSCTPPMDHSDMGGHMMSMTSPECQANDTALLTSMAYCMAQNCPESVTPAEREDYWRMRMLDTTGTVRPKWTYGEALSQVENAPTLEFNKTSHDVLNHTVLADKESWAINNRFNILFDHIEMLQARYTFIILSLGLGTPILLTLTRHMPHLATLKPYLIWPSIYKTHRMQPLPYLLGNAPTAGQALWLTTFFILNLILSCVNYQTMPPGTMPWGFTPREELLAYIGYRTGHFAYMLLPLIILFSSRNNVLLWVTDWSYDTYLVLHRWVARLFGVYAVVHSVVLLCTYTGSGGYATASREAYWLWGIVATVVACAMVVGSGLWVRRRAYEVFLITHIIMAVFVLAGCWYHVILKWGYNFYANWLYAAMAVWAFDRTLRILRVLKNGIKHATVTEIGSNHLRVDIQGVRWASRPGHIAYAYFPTLNKFRPWENHPFSVNSTSLLRNTVSLTSASSPTRSLDGSISDPEKSVARVDVHASQESRNGTGVTLIIKKNAGLTRLLQSHTKLSTLLEGPYPGAPAHEALECDHLLLLGGGIGITGLVAWMHAHSNVKLAWSVKSSDEPLVRELDGVLAGVADKQVYIGERLDIDGLLEHTASAGYKKVGVVVCGPAGMCDDVRAKVAGLGRGRNTVFELVVEAFSW